MWLSMVGRLVRDEEDACSNPVIPTSFYTGSVDKLSYWEKGKRWYFWCPGCKEEHFFTDGWTFNGDMKSPTIDPSLVVQMTLYGENKVPYRQYGGGLPASEKTTAICHLFIQNGKIRYQPDSYHKLAGKTVEMISKY